MSAFAHTILVAQEIGQAPTLQTIGVVDSPRKKRPHSKSRRGCIACKCRRVKCDERVPCSGCVKRNIQCLQPSPQHVIGSSLSRTSAHFKIDTNPAINLLYLELFHHWDKETRATLAFPQIWPVVMQQAFNEDFIMSAILCVAAMHLASLCPQSTKYSHASMQLIVKTVQLFRKNLSRPFTRDNCEALMGTALLINYISWSDIGFLDDDNAEFADGRLNLAQDQLFLLSPGIVRVWFQAIPIFINEGSVFTQLTQQDPRLNIERALVRRGEDPTRFVEPLMKMWDDNGAECPNTVASDGPTSYAWRLLLGLETELSSCRRGSSVLLRDAVHSEEQILERLRDTVTKITTQSASLDYKNASNQSARSSFEYITRRISPLLCCASLLEYTTEEDSSIMAECKADVEQLFYGFPIFCCGPFAQLIPQGDPRALIFLFHFYRAARILLAPGGRCWWATARSRVMEKAILKELKYCKVGGIQGFENE